LGQGTLLVAEKIGTGAAFLNVRTCAPFRFAVPTRLTRFRLYYLKNKGFPALSGSYPRTNPQTASASTAAHSFVSNDIVNELSRRYISLVTLLEEA
jgi:hypothetical protein